MQRGKGALRKVLEKSFLVNIRLRSAGLVESRSTLYSRPAARPSEAANRQLK